MKSTHTPDTFTQASLADRASWSGRPRLASGAPLTGATGVDPARQR